MRRRLMFLAVVRLDDLLLAVYLILLIFLLAVMFAWADAPEADSVHPSTATPTTCETQETPA